MLCIFTNKATPCIVFKKDKSNRLNVFRVQSSLLIQRFVGFAIQAFVAIVSISLKTSNKDKSRFCFRNRTGIYMHCRTRAVSNQELIIDYIYLYTVYISQGKTIYELYLVKPEMKKNENQHHRQQSRFPSL